jgi:hypothetical protein
MSRFCVPRRLAFVVHDESEAPAVFLMSLPDGPPVVLRDISAVIWCLAADGEPDVVGAVSRAVGVARQEVEDHVVGHLRDLAAEGFLECRSD